MSEFINTIEVLGDDAVCDSIIERTITEFKDDNLTEIGDYAFSGCTELTVVDCPNAKKLGFTNPSNSMAYIFLECTALREVNFPEVESSGNKMFIGLHNLVSISMPKLKSISGDQFIEDTGITKLLLPGLDGLVYGNSLRNNKQLRLVDLGKCTRIAGSALLGCSDLSAMILKNTTVVTLENVSAVGGTQIASGTGYIYVPSSLVDSYKTATNWSTYSSQFRGLFDDESIQQGIIDGTLIDLNNNEIEEIPNSGFRSYQNLKSVSSTSATTVGSHAFYGCGALESINLPNVTTIDKNSFANCPQLKSLILPSVISAGNNSLNCLAEYIKLQSLTGLGSWTFNNFKCVILDLPSVAYISKNGICNSQSLKALVLRITSSICTLGGTFDDYFNNANIYVPRALIEEYKVANNWSTYADKFRALEDYTVDGTVTGALDETKL